MSQWARSDKAMKAMEIVSVLQRRFVNGLGWVAVDEGEGVSFEEVSWERDGGRHGGGVRFCSGGNDVFNRASVNVSQVHYDDEPEKRLGSATALSTIIHPHNPHAPSMHMHISWTEMKSGEGYWRMMADLNPSIENAEDREGFQGRLKKVVGELYEGAAAQGDRYFYIPALERHRGVVHFYLENFNSGDEDADRSLARRLGGEVIDVYLGIVRLALSEFPEIDDGARDMQLAYHTLYLFQVLTLDRGTTSGLLVHDQNDLGIMGSIPAAVDRELLSSWRGMMPEVQKGLLDALVGALPGSGVVDDAARLRLAKAVREHYREYPGALGLQASGDVVPPTVKNHQSA